MSLFGSTAAAAPATSTPLFGTTATKPATGGLFGSSAPAAATSTPLFGSTAATTTSTPGGLFGAKPAATTTTPATGGLFGSSATTAAAPTASGGLFGASSSTPAATTGGGLFGAKPATSTLGGGGLFGSSTTSTASTASAFAAPPATTTASLGLGGVQQQGGGGLGTSGTATSSLTGSGDKENAKETEWQQAATLIRDMIPLLEERLKKNRDLIEETENMNVDYLSLEESIDKARGLISEVRRDVRTATEMSDAVALLVSNDKCLMDSARRVQDQANTANQTAHANAIKQHLIDRTQAYELEMHALQDRVNHMRSRLEKLINGEPSLTMTELDDYFLRCDTTVTNAQHHVLELGRDIEALKNLLIEQGYTHLRRGYVPVSTAIPTDRITSNEGGTEFFPSHASLAMIGSALRAPAPTQTTTGGLGLTTGTSLFGNTGGTSLFGSSTATKPAFSGGSLFGPSSTATSTAATAPTTSLFGAKPAATSATNTFASTVANNSSGLLFSSKK